MRQTLTSSKTYVFRLNDAIFVFFIPYLNDLWFTYVTYIGHLLNLWFTYGLLQSIGIVEGLVSCNNIKVLSKKAQNQTVLAKTEKKFLQKFYEKDSTVKFLAKTYQMNDLYFTYVRLLTYAFFNHR